MLTFSAHIGNRAPIGTAQRKHTAAARTANVKCAARSSSSISGQNSQNVSRRQVLETATLAAVLAGTPLSAVAATSKAPKGFMAYQDRADGYQFLYPFGWQEISVQGQDVVFKDVVEPLESVSVSFIPTDSATIADFGPTETVAETLARQVLTAPGQQVELLKSEMRETNGQKYLEFEFTVDAKRYRRHSVAVVTVTDGKFFTLTTGANERRWSKIQDKLRTMVRSFQMIDYSLV